MTSVTVSHLSLNGIPDPAHLLKLSHNISLPKPEFSEIDNNAAQEKKKVKLKKAKHKG